MKIKAILLAALAALIIPVSVNAQSETEGERPAGKKCNCAGGKKSKAKHGLKKIDTDGNRQISLEEAEAANAERLIENFEAIDGNGDGVLTGEEMKAFHQAKREERRQQREAEEGA